jgi:hypothetical protein
MNNGLIRKDINQLGSPNYCREFRFTALFIIRYSIFIIHYYLSLRDANRSQDRQQIIKRLT